MLDFDLINCFQTLKLVKKFAGKGNSRFRDGLNMFECFNMFDIHFVHLSCNNLFRFVDMIMEQLKLAVPRYLRE